MKKIIIFLLPLFFHAAYAQSGPSYDGATAEIGLISVNGSAPYIPFATTGTSGQAYSGATTRLMLGYNASAPDPNFPYYVCGTANPCTGGSPAGSFTLTTTGTSGAATYSGGVLNIPIYGSSLTPNLTGVATNGSGVAQQQTASNISSILGYAPGIQLQKIDSLWGFGTSFTSGVGSVYPWRSGFALFARDSNVSAEKNFGITGAGSASITSSAFNNFNPPPPGAFPAVSWLDQTPNDAANDACGATAGTNCTKNHQFNVQAAMHWLMIPSTNRIMASAATKSGTWINNTAIVIFTTQLTSPGLPQLSTGNGNTLTFNIPSSASPIVAVTYLVTNSATGTFTISVDSILQTNGCPGGGTTFSAGPCGGQALFGDTKSYQTQEFAVTPGLPHRVDVTQTNASAVIIAGVDWVPVSGMNHVLYIDANAFYTNYALYNAVDAAVVTQEKANGMPVSLIDQPGGNPGVNATTDLATSATTTCNASTASGHPNDLCGYPHLVQTIENQEIVDGFVFSTPLGGSDVRNDAAFPALPIFAPEITTNSRASAYGTFNLKLANEFGMDFYNGGGLNGGLGWGGDSSSGAPFSGGVHNRMYGTSQLWTCVTLETSGSAVGNSNFSDKWCAQHSTGNTWQFGTATATQFVSTNSTTVTATPGTNVTSVTCASATCTTSRGSYTIVGGTATTGTIATLSWTATPGLPWVCTATMNGGAGFLGIGNTIATTTGMAITAGLGITGVTLTVNYSCQP